MAKIFENILNDNLSGSGSVLEGVIDLLSGYLHGNNNVDIVMLNGELDKVFDKFPNFALLYHFMSSFKNAFKNVTKTENKEVQNFILSYKKKYDGTQQEVSERFIGQVDVERKNILLHSNSSAIKNLFNTLKRKNKKAVVWQTVSSPANEGVLQAQSLNNAGFTVNLFHEDAVSLFVNGIDMALFGADMIFDDFFVNKTGTYPLCLMMKRFGKPVYVIAEKRKVIDTNDTAKTDMEKLLTEYPKPDYELATEVNYKIKVRNYYFEKIPVSLVSKIFY